MYADETIFCLQTLPTMTTNTGKARKEGTLSEFDQGEFFDDRTEDVSMDSEGFIYIPERFHLHTYHTIYIYIPERFAA